MDTSMSPLWIIIIIVLVLAVIIGNIMLLKYSAKLKFPTPSNKTDNNKKYDDEDDW